MLVVSTFRSAGNLLKEKESGLIADLFFFLSGLES